MFAAEMNRGQAQFTFKPSHGVRYVAIAGTFSSWKPIAMQRRRDGTFEAKLALKPGTYEYRFVVDQHWVSDPDNHNQVANPFGATNSVARFQ